ncbi:MAG: zf-HC2 domain-containing protein, partial [bacterium]|nr:zf-HC2 domain-containing protein [bacterium]
MKCSIIHKLLPDYLTHEVNGDQERSVKEHLASCEKCREELAFLKKYFQTLSSLEKKDAPPDFLEKLHDRLEKSHPFKELLAKLFIPFPLKVPLELAGVTAVIVFIILLIKPVPLPEQFQKASPESPEQGKKIMRLTEEQAGKKMIRREEKEASFGQEERPETGTEPIIADSMKAGTAQGPGKTAGMPAETEDSMVNIALLPKD